MKIIKGLWQDTMCQQEGKGWETHWKAQGRCQEGGHTGIRNSYFNTLDFMKENVEFSYRIYTVNAHILFLTQLGF